MKIKILNSSLYILLFWFNFQIYDFIKYILPNPIHKINVWTKHFQQIGCIHIIF